MEMPGSHEKLRKFLFLLFKECLYCERSETIQRQAAAPFGLTVTEQYFMSCALYLYRSSCQKPG